MLDLFSNPPVEEFPNFKFFAHYKLPYGSARDVDFQHFHYYLNEDKMTLLQKEFLLDGDDRKEDGDVETKEFQLNKNELYILKKSREYGVDEDDIAYTCHAFAQVKEDRFPEDYHKEWQEWYDLAVSIMSSKIAKNRTKAILKASNSTKPKLFGGSGITKVTSREEAMQKARQAMYDLQKKQLINYFEKEGGEKTAYNRVNHGDHSEYFYGVPVFEDKKLKGFNMMTFVKEYHPFTGAGVRLAERPYTDENGKQIFMTVDEYMKFEKDMSRKDDRIGTVMRLSKEEKEVNKLAKKFQKSKFSLFMDKIKTSLTRH